MAPVSSLLSGFDAVSVVAAAAVLALKATVLLLLPVAFTRLRPQASASARHFAWFLSLAALLALPALSALSPGWTMPGLALPARWAASPAVSPQPSTTTTPGPAATPSPSSIAADPPSRGPAVPAAASLTSLAALDAEPGSTGGSRSGPTPDLTALVLLLAWLAGAAIVIVQLVVARLQLRDLARAAAPLDDQPWTSLLDDARSDLGFARDILLLRGPADVLPMTWGLRRTRVLLPASADTWPEARKRVVLRHELAHAQRRDCLTQLVAQLTCALYWFHPLAWHAARRMQIERERACDDLVLAAETRPSEYAEHLVAVVRSLREARGLALGAVGFARRSEFEGRLLAVLDPMIARRPLTRRVIRIAAVAALVVLAPLAALRATATAKDDTGRALLVPGENMIASRTPPAGRLVGGTNDVRKAPDATPLAAGWKWAHTQKVSEPHWIGWWVDRGDAHDGNLLSDTQGLWLGDLDDNWRGPSLQDVLLGREPSRERTKDASGDHRIGLLLHESDGRIDRVRAQSLSLPAEFGGQPLLWLGHGETAQSLELLDGLARSGSSELRGHFVELISFHDGPEQVLPRLQNYLSTREPEKVRLEATQGLGHQRSEQTVRILSGLLSSDPSPEVRSNAAEALGQLQLDSASEVLLKAARRRDTDDHTRQEIVDALAQHASEAAATGLDQVIDANPDPDPQVEQATDVEERAQAAMEYEKEKAEAAADHKADEKQAYAEALRERGRHDSETELQAQAVEAYRHFPAEKARPRLREIALHHDKASVRTSAIETLAHFGDPADLSFLAQLARNDPDEEISGMAAEAMRFYSCDAVLPAVRALAAPGSRREVRIRAIETLVHLDDPKALDVVEQMIRDEKDPEITMVLVDDLQQFPVERATPILKDIARGHSSTNVRREALDVLTRVNPDAALPLMEELIQSKRSR